MTSRPRAYRCSQCGLGFPSEDELDEHECLMTLGRTYERGLRVLAVLNLQVAGHWPNPWERL
jgi:hypothetical protein